MRSAEKNSLRCAYSGCDRHITCRNLCRKHYLQWWRSQTPQPVTGLGIGKTLLTHNGKTQTLLQWSKEVGIAYHTLYQRYKNGWPADKILSTTPRSYGVKKTPLRSLLGVGA